MRNRRPKVEHAFAVAELDPFMSDFMSHVGVQLWIQ
jgi:hypothetical protein